MLHLLVQYMRLQSICKEEQRVHTNVPKRKEEVITTQHDTYDSPSGHIVDNELNAYFAMRHRYK